MTFSPPLTARSPGPQQLRARRKPGRDNLMRGIVTSGQSPWQHRRGHGGVPGPVRQRRYPARHLRCVDLRPPHRRGRSQLGAGGNLWRIRLKAALSSRPGYSWVPAGAAGAGRVGRYCGGRAIIKLESLRLTQDGLQPIWRVGIEVTATASSGLLPPRLRRACRQTGTRGRRWPMPDQRPTGRAGLRRSRPTAGRCSGQIL